MAPLIFILGNIMGLFSTKYKTHVGTSVTRVIEDDAIPNSVLMGVTKSIIQSDEQMIENTLEELSNSIGVRANRMYNYGKTTYVNGVPKGVLLNSKSGESLVKQAIEEDHGPVTIDYYHYGPLNNLHFGRTKLQEQYQYNPATNEFIINSTTVYLVDMIVVVREATVSELANGSLDSWGISPKNGRTANRHDSGNVAGFSPFRIDDVTNTDYLLVKYNNISFEGVITEGSFNIPVSGVDILADYHHVKYIKNGQPAYWLYRANSGEHQAIDSLYDTEHTSGGSYFPWAYFRYNKVSTVDNQTTEQYKSTKRLLDFIGLDYKVVGESINANPDIADVEQAMVVMAVPANSTNPMDVRYLYDFFSRLYALQVTSTPTTARSEGIQNIFLALANKAFIGTGSINSLVIQDKKFKMTLDYRRITKAKRAGYLGKIGSHQGGYGVEVEKVDGFTMNGEPYEFNTDVKYHYYRRQISEGVYEEIRVEGLIMKYHILAANFETADENEDILLVPIDMSIVDNYSIMDREVLYCRSLHYVFNSVVVQKIKWYQQGIFKYLMIFIAIVISFYFGPGGAALWAAIISGSIVAITIALIMIMINLFVQYLISLAIKLFIKIIGGKLALILAVIVLLYTGYNVFQSGSFAGAPFAQELLSLSTNLAEASFSDIMKDKYENLEQEYSEFNDMISSKKELLEKAKDELSYNNYLSPTIIFGENPSEFYDRTVHSGNIGVLAIDAVSSYYDIALSLPSLKQSIGDE